MPKDRKERKMQINICPWTGNEQQLFNRQSPQLIRQTGQNLRLLRENYYCPLKITVFERDDYGDIEEEGFECDGRYAVRYEDEIIEQLKREHSFEGCDRLSLCCSSSCGGLFVMSIYGD